MSKRDYYEVLGVQKNASEDELKENEEDLLADRADELDESATYQGHPV